MAMYAPATPTTRMLANKYPISDTTLYEIELSRNRFGQILGGLEPGTVGAIGGCAMNEQSGIIREEGQAQLGLTQAVDGLYVVQRRPPWKPRTRAEDWHGLETTNPELAYRTLVEEATQGAGIAIELGYEYHAERYGDLLTFAWFGGRQTDTDMIRRVAGAERNLTLPLAVKNGLSGDISPALQLVEELRDIRGDGAAPVVLLYRGGANAQNPQAWERQYRGALERTGGVMMVDIAHGSEMAHDPNGTFAKSAEGQITALGHVIQIAEAHGESPTGLMAEASDADSPTDPHMPHQIALDGLLHLHAIRTNLIPDRV